MSATARLCKRWARSAASLPAIEPLNSLKKSRTPWFRLCFFTVLVFWGSRHARFHAGGDATPAHLPFRQERAVACQRQCEENAG